MVEQRATLPYGWWHHNVPHFHGEDRAGEAAQCSIYPTTDVDPSLEDQAHVDSTHRPPGRNTVREPTKAIHKGHHTNKMSRSTHTQVVVPASICSPSPEYTPKCMSKLQLTLIPNKTATWSNEIYPFVSAYFGAQFSTSEFRHRLDAPLDDHIHDLTPMHHKGRILASRRPPRRQWLGTPESLAWRSSSRPYPRPHLGAPQWLDPDTDLDLRDPGSHEGGRI
jgi:hypothetical protein